MSHAVAIGLSLLLALPAGASQPGPASRAQLLANANDRIWVARKVMLVEPGIETRVAELGQRVAAASGEPSGYPFVFRVLNDRAPIAWAAGGGFVYISTELLEVLESEEELLAVLAHEVAHDRLDHALGFQEREESSDRVKEVGAVLIGVTFQVGMLALAAQGGGAPPPNFGHDSLRTGIRLGLLIGSTVANAYLRGYSEDRELEADEKAEGYLRQLSLDPCMLPQALARLKPFPSRYGIEEAEFPGHAIAAAPGLEPRIRASQKRIGHARGVEAACQGLEVEPTPLNRSNGAAGR